ncbi:hypothetical protein BU24DRAFT_425844 [Aaosphaeria arxii CBS 175.79]|uniref:Checkpoint protein kinase-like protein n=1 Tax=Aaosphaeria arxii CBS 175.79 TaxID=1450172 RepID=A0A6A5XGR1_9PLEO|nr:uncharacterized protein BU24DRAFT_425844 [Aaosphaeria arxii CBS 175.79]KAF2012027.1 hypothetical protein BU24DRAFT_425844 [Aaosphaeria arxii CBS 175.79]
MGSEDLIDFEIIENQKENIQSLPSGRSAKALAQLYTPPLSSASGQAPSPSQLHDSNSAARQEFEKELQNIDESDDPLDVYDRYVKWTLDAYPSAQNTPQSQLCPLLERATKAFQSSTHYKNDPRYLKLWLHYIRLFSDAPREAFAYLTQHGIGDGLALFYEEFAAWLETAGRWTQAEEVYAMGIEREARPTERLIRKYGEFQHRFESRPQGAAEPTSPALPAVRPALAAKIDPFSHASPLSLDPQAQHRTRMGGGTAKPGKQKLAIFSDAEQPPKPGSSGSSKGWDSIGSLADRKKENTTEARPWAGETLKVGKKNTGVQKMMIFKDENLSSSPNEKSKPHPFREFQQTVNPKTGKLEVISIDLTTLYPDPDDLSVELCFEELRAEHRGLLDRDWNAIRRRKEQQRRQESAEAEAARQAKEKPTPLAPKVLADKSAQPKTVPLKGSIDDNAENDENTPPSQAELDKAKAARRARREERANRTRKIKVMEVREIRGETQTIQTNLDSPTGKKVKRRKGGKEATMTLHTKEAMDDIYEIFNQPLKNPAEAAEEVESEEDSSEDDDDDDDEDGYTSAGDSTGTGHLSGATSEFGDDTTAADFTLRTTVDEDEDDDSDDESQADMTDVKSVSEWSEFTESKHVPKEHRQGDEDEDDDEDNDSVQSEEDSFDEIPLPGEEKDANSDIATPTSPGSPGSLPTSFAPPPLEGYDIPTRPYRDPAQAANNRLPFMTPIVEKTESSIAVGTVHKEYYATKTPSRSKGTPAILEDGEPWSSPFHDLDKDIEIPGKVTQLALREAKKPEPVVPPTPLDTKPKGPIIKDTQCNPVDEAIREVILSQIQPPLLTYEGYFGDGNSICGKGGEIRKYTKAISKISKNANDKTATNLSLPPVLKLDGSDRMYTIKRELGKGAFAPVYLAESEPIEDDDEDKPVQMGKGEFGLKRNSLEAIKMEEPPSPWEFYIMRQAKRRLGVSRAAHSVVHAYEMHMFKDECYLVEEFRDQGTLLDLVNIARADNGVMDEQLAMFFTIELFRTVESLHSKGVIHGDLKSDNILVRFNSLPSDEWAAQYHRDGRNGWAEKGVCLIDFGRGIDMKVFKPDVQFIADWKTTEADCAEMRELRPWTYQIDYHGLAGIVHNLLFGKYISTVAERGAALGAGATKTYRIRESLKRYWQTDIWNEVLDLLLNPLMHLEPEEGRKLPVTKGMKSVREKMEAYLEENCEKGVGLKALVRRMEESVKRR